VGKIPIAEGLTLDEDELEFQFVRASGPGGQNVNKVASAVKLRWDVANSACLPDAVKTRLIRLAGQRVTTDGVLVIDARRYRTRERNRQDAVDRVTALVLRAARPRKPRRRTQPTRASRQRRRVQKRRRSEIKRQRGRVDPAED
jgi:ribosome-associated protein